MNIYLAGGCDEKYLTVSETYLRTMNQNSNVQNVFFTIDFDISAEYKTKFERIKFISISSNIIKSPNPNKCLQHGGFLEASDFTNDNSVIVFTDTDITIQRAFTDKELSMLSEFKNGDIGINADKVGGFSLVDEVQLLKPNITIEQLLEKYPDINELKVYNTGVIVTTKKTYKELYQLYNQNWDAFKNFFEHPAKQQWLLSYLIQKNFNPVSLPHVIHANGYAPQWEVLFGRNVAGYKFCIGSEVAVFNHNIRHESARKIKSQKRVIKRLAIALIVLVLVCSFLIIRNIL